MRFFTIFFTINLFFSNILHAAEQGCSKVYASLVLEEKTGNILFEKRSDETVYPASLVKLMTLYLTFEALKNHQLDPEKILTVSERGEEVSRVNKGNSLHLKRGDKIMVREAILAVIVKSFNEAAVTLAETVASNEWEFAKKMNDKAQELGMIGSSFRNASGLHDEGQYTTSYDLARLALAIKRDFPKHYHLFAMKKFFYNGTEYETHNHVLVDYRGAEGLKTGFTNASGFNLITTAKQNDQRVISVLVGCSSYQQRDKFTKNLLNEAFEKLAKNEKNEMEVKLSEGFNYKSKIEKNNYEDEVRFGMVLLDE
jgi:D-alanyl-D-alanine carboxypeptidase